MTSSTPHSCTRRVLSIDTPDNPVPGPFAVCEPSAELLDRALVGWERFIGKAEEPSDV
ncbi:hypothetical protein OG765_37150 [Streptomyces sp. NBC_00555]|uniref:hypothetical protein n=1 Tax=Streptomyces sp. NBC_00555 TaxID=2903662 RepID=UPI00224E1F65|nr:hypothetical protein [Streptomyces sp. NBC_00555]MCX5016553.1 hypothetical protein [Streptomyces sp. NBC_00555]